MSEWRSDSDLILQIASSAQAEAMACSRRLTAIGELHARRQILVEDDCGRELWSCDVWDAVSAEVAAAQGITQAAASEQLRYALALKDRLPGVGALFAQGLIGFRAIRVVVARTALALDPDVLAKIDAELANQLRCWGPMSIARLEQAVDAVVVRYDPAARRRAASSSKSRHVDFDMSGNNGTAALWGILYATDARALNRRLTEMASALCSGDPRTVDQRRADALGALASGQQALVCGCEDKDCPAAGERQVPSVIVHVVAEVAELSNTADLHGYDDTYRELHSAEEIREEIRRGAQRVPEQPLDPPAPNPPTLVGGSVMPAALVNELIRTGRAVVRKLRVPGSESEPEPRYRPSVALSDFIRCRDLTCRFPGCGRSAEICDIDHTVPYEVGGLTHPSNLKLLCRKHHLLKTFWRGDEGWSDRQLPDATIIWTAPSGTTYRTRPGSRLLIPSLSLPTGELPDQHLDNLPTVSGLTMPKRKRTRAQNTLARILSERR